MSPAPVAKWLRQRTFNAVTAGSNPAGGIRDVRAGWEHVFVPEHRPIIANKGRPPTEVSTAFERECRHHGLTVFHRYASGQVRCKRCVGEAVTRRHQKIKRTPV